MPDDMVGLSFVGWVEGGQLSKPLVRQVFDYGDDLLGFVRDILLPGMDYPIQRLR